MADEPNRYEPPRVTIPRPTSERDCASIVLTYVYVAANIIDETLEEQQRNYCRRTQRLVNDLPSHCACPVVNGRKCTGQATCVNRRRKVACAGNCGTECKNNPWKNNLWAIGVKTYLKFISTERGYGIFAWRKIKAYRYVGEYTGRVFGNDDDSEAGPWPYHFNLEPVDQFIDASREGSACRLINHSCDPNVFVQYVVHEGLLKIVFMTKKTIKPDEELTIDYTWVFEDKKFMMTCDCKSKNCDGKIGTYKPGKQTARKSTTAPSVESPTHSMPLPDNDDNELDFDDTIFDAEEVLVQDALDEPSQFPMVDANRSAEVQRQNSSQPVFEQRPSTFRENHVFQPSQGAWAVLNYGGAIRHLSGRIVQCYRNEHGVIIYVLRSMQPGLIEFHLPRWVLFHYQEDAVFAQNSLYSSVDLQQIREYSSPQDSNSGDGLHFELVPDYVNLWRQNLLPQTRLVLASQDGPLALGAPRHRLERFTQPGSDDDETADSSQDESCTPKKKKQHGVPRMSLTPAAPVQHFSKKTTRSLRPSTSKQLNLQSPTVPDDESSESSCGPQFIVPPHANYNRNFRRNFDEVHDEVEANVMLRRMFENSVENSTLFSLSRLPRNYITYEELYYIIRRDLEYHYFYAPPAQRRFLDYTHYRTSTEVAAPGSMYWNWCSLCRNSHTFTSDKQQNRHYFQSHCYIAYLYKCPTCGEPFNLPSAYWEHLWTCDPLRAADHRADVIPAVSDGIADNRAHHSGNHNLFLIQPGLPLMRFSGTAPRPTHRRGEKADFTPAISMNPTTMRPTDPTVPTVLKKWKVQKSFKKITSWEGINYAKNVDPHGQPPNPDPPQGPKYPKRRPRPQANDDESDDDLNDDGPGPSTRASKKRSRNDVRQEEDDEQQVQQPTSRKTVKSKKVHPPSKKSTSKVSLVKTKAKKKKERKRVIEQSSTEEDDYEEVNSSDDQHQLRKRR